MNGCSKNTKKFYVIVFFLFNVWDTILFTRLQAPVCLNKTLIPIITSLKGACVKGEYICFIKHSIIGSAYRYIWRHPINY